MAKATGGPFVFGAALKLQWVDEKGFRAAVKDGQRAGLALRKSFVAKITPQSDAVDAPLIFAISTATVDRVGDTIAVDGWKTGNFRKNPVVLWAHDRSEPPVGKSIREFVEDGALKSAAVFTSKDLYPFGAMVAEMYKQGFLNAVSVGFQPEDYEVNEERESPYGVAFDFLKQELLEYSAVPVPANPDALLEARAAGIDLAPLREWAEKALDEGGVLVLPRAKVEAAWKAADAKARVVLQSAGIKDPGDVTGDDESDPGDIGPHVQKLGDAVKSLGEHVAKMSDCVKDLADHGKAHGEMLAQHGDLLKKQQSTLSQLSDIASKLGPGGIPAEPDGKTLIGEIVSRVTNQEVERQLRMKRTGRLD